MVTRQGEARCLRSRPHQHAILISEVRRRIELFARHNNTDDSLASAIPNRHILLLEGNLHPLVLYLIIDNRGIVDVARAYGSRLSLDNEEVLQRLGAIYRESEVSEVVAELHRFVMYAIYPTPKHWNLRSRIGTQGVACIAEMFEGNRLLWLCGLNILGNACRKQKLAAMRVVHQKLDSPERTVILSNHISARRPSPHIVIHSKAVLIGTIDEALILPSVAPRIGNNPSAYLVFFHLAYNAVFVKVELDAVVISADSKSMVERLAPLLDILHADNTCCLVCRRIGNGSPRAA